jgi:hypothetical protein
LTIVANESGATVIFLESHPLWAAAQRHRRERAEAVRRHPSYLARQRGLRAAADNAAVIRNFRTYSSSDTPA